MKSIEFDAVMIYGDPVVIFLPGEMEKSNGRVLGTLIMDESREYVFHLNIFVAKQLTRFQMEEIGAIMEIIDQIAAKLRESGVIA